MWQRLAPETLAGIVAGAAAWQGWPLVAAKRFGCIAVPFPIFDSPAAPAGWLLALAKIAACMANKGQMP